MKYNMSKKLTIGAARTLKSLQQAMVTSLAKKSFEEISVQELCEIAMLPRATFYNYFDDKYDLLDYCFLCLHQEIDGKDPEATTCQKRLMAVMINCINYVDQCTELVDRILKYNHPEQFFMNQLRFYLTNRMIAAFQDCQKPTQYQIPHEMAAKMLSDAVLNILEWKYLYKNECSKEQASMYLQKMVSGIEET